MNAYLPRKLCV